MTTPIPPHGRFVGLSEPLAASDAEAATEVVQAAIAEAAHAALLVWANDPNRAYWVPSVMRVTMVTDDPDLFVRDLAQVKVEYTAELLLGRLMAEQQAGTVRIAGECDAPSPPTMDMTTGKCRCLVCARCGHHTGNANQGHFWLRCSVTKADRKAHFCCPDDCELEAKPDAG